MATGDSIIRVSIIGDAKKLVGAVQKADRSMGGLVKKAAAGFVAFQAVDKTFDFLGDSTKEADRLGDAMARLGHQLPPEFVDRLDETADDFVKLGASKQDILELEAILVDFGTAAGIADDSLTALAPQAAATATALSLIDDQGRDSSAIMDLITKAAGGSEKAARELGVELIDTKDAGAQLNNILTQLKPKLDDATTGTADLEQKQAEMQARVETLQAKIGEQLNPVLTNMLTIISDGIEDIDGAIWGFQQLGQKIQDIGKNAQNALAPVARLLDMLSQSGSGANRAIGGFDAFDVGRSERRTSQDTRDRNTRNGVVNNRIGGP